MKKLIIYTIVTLFLFSMVAVSKVEAFSFGMVSGYVDPYGGSVNNGTTTTFSSVSYSFKLTAAAPGAEMKGLNLHFDSDKFLNIQDSAIEGLNPDNWDIAFKSPSWHPDYFAISTSGTTLGVGDSLTFSLRNVTVFNSELDKLGIDGIFHQGFLAFGTYGFPYGHSTIVNPEPSTIALLGIGLAGLVGVDMRRRMKKKAIGKS